MRASSATRPADTIPVWCGVTAAAGCAGLVFFVASLAMSSPFPTPKDRVWVVDQSPVRVASAAPMGAVVEQAISAEDEGEPARPAAASMATMRRAASTDMLVWEPTFILASLPAGDLEPAPEVSTDADPEPVGSIGPTPKKVVAPRDPQDVVDDYLWEVYRREPIKKDGSGDFTWKDPAAAKKLGMSLKDYVIRGMDRDFRETLYHMGKALDADGLNWSMLSAFRDDYRQRLASGLKARVGYSLHGGSRRTGGYGHGRAIDITIAGDGDASVVWRWIDRHGARYAIARPMPGYDPAHIQARGNWKKVAAKLRSERLEVAERASRKRTASAD
ncbi:hypothetical protein A33M_2706 [Rhodovulum sp. PH10]|uniref:hypothetical protein n=1 Tax=Rhodovulum sp. PH10 TaxID=1187851 RepID=UPI00027C2510|nr:hypothetical protein [Rhodovulum sp. PH10]EJW11925.1 hypothetical protein A33M_2706 [Rhodovulum sp. PH10]